MGTTGSAGAHTPPEVVEWLPALTRPGPGGAEPLRGWSWVTIGRLCGCQGVAGRGDGGGLDSTRGAAAGRHWTCAGRFLVSVRVQECSPVGFASRARGVFHSGSGTCH